jgi:HAD superfamily hydrolase (TIGR01458 family)
MINGVLLDIAGVVMLGSSPVPGAIQAIERLRGAGLPIRFVSNTTRSTRDVLFAKLVNAGIALSIDELFTPARAAREWLESRQASPLLLVHPGLAPEFLGLPEHRRLAVVVGDAAYGFDYAALNDAFRALMDGAGFLALAANKSFQDSDGKLSLDAGPFVAALEYASGRKAEIVGKPSPAFFGAALDSMNCSAADAVMIGDDIDSDVAGALDAGVGTAVLVRTGKYRPGDEAGASRRPTLVADDLGVAVERVLSRRGTEA